MYYNIYNMISKWHDNPAFLSGLRMLRSLFFLIPCFLFFTACQQQTAEPENSTIPKTHNAADLSLRLLKPGLWIHTSHHTFTDGTRYPSNGLVVREDDGLVLIDPAWGAAATTELLSLIKHDIGLPIKRAYATHFHGDRTAGVDILAAAGIDVFTHPLTQKLSRENGNPVPQNALMALDKPGASVVMGQVEVFFPGHGHAPDNIMLWLPEHRVLYGGCAIRELSTDSLGNTEDADLASWKNAVQRAQTRYPQVETVVPGHGDSAGPETLSHMLKLFE